MVLFSPKMLKPQSENIDKLYNFARDHSEIVVYGPTESAKSFECFKLAHALCSSIPNFQAVLLRKAKTTIYSTVLQTLKNHILPYNLADIPKNPVKAHGGPHSPTKLVYKDTGAELWFLGEDDKTGKALGTQWDLAVYSQCEQASFTFWEELSGRCTGRAKNWIVDGNYHGLLLGECNPSSSRHFLRNKWKEGNLQMLKFLHTDNAMIYYNGEYTPYGKKVIEDLKRKYSGHLYERLYLGNWVGVSGGVYVREFDPNVHEVEEQFILNQIQPDWIWTAAMDFGFRHPFVCSLFVGPPDNSVLYHYKEVYKSELDPDETKALVFRMLDKYLPPDKNLKWVVGDHKPEFHKTLEKIGLPMINAEKEVTPGIATVKECLINNRIFFNKNALVNAPDEEQIRKGYPTRTLEEFEVYAYKPEEKQNGSAQDEIPVSLHDDGLDTLRYQIVRWLQPTYKPLGVIGGSNPEEPESFF